MSDLQAPQAPADARQVVRGIDKDGKLLFSQVGVQELDYRARFGATAWSGTENTVSIGEKHFVIDEFGDSLNQFRIGDDVLCVSLDSPREIYMWGEITNKTGTEPSAE